MKKIIYAVAMVMLFANCEDAEVTKVVNVTLSDFVSDIDTATAELVLNTIEGYDVQTAGVAYAIAENPTIADETFTADLVNNNITIDLSGLSDDTTYYARAFITTTSNETFYSDQVSFKTNGIETSTTVFGEVSVSDISDMTAAFTASISNDNGYAIVSKGFVYSVSEEFGENIETIVVISEEFSSVITELIGGATYYVKAYAENSFDTFYTEPVMFTTEYTYKEYDGDVMLSTQAEVEEFAAEKYTDIKGSLLISIALDEPEQRIRYKSVNDKTKGRREPIDEDVPTTDISDLRGLISLSSIEGSLIVFGNSNLTNLEGLNNINLIISEEPPVEGSMTEVPPGLVVLSYNDSLTSLVGLESLTNALYLIIEHNNSLVNLEGLNNLDLIVSEGSMMGPPSGYIDIAYNTSLINLVGLESLVNASVLNIRYNDGITSLDGLDNLIYIEDVYIENNETLSNYCALGELVSASINEQTGFEMSLYIYSNLYNPSYEDLVEGDCDIANQDN
ncbi:MAG: hypothetical protein HRT66_04065 [Flavobacteriaceae bacterium]|nr:hypothetical protein [Flavobacteriaceae bacterium]